VVPTRFVLFALVGFVGLLMYLAILALCRSYWEMTFVKAQTIATLVTIAFNFLLNNVVTFRDLRLRRWRLITGLLTFYAACGVGALTNISFGNFLYREGISWYIAGLCGLGVGAIWNYGVNSVITWRRGRQRTPRAPETAVSREQVNVIARSR